MHLDLHALELGGDLCRLRRICFLDRLDQHVHLVDAARIEQLLPDPGAERLLEILRRFVGNVRIALGDLKHAIGYIRLLDGGRAADAAGIIGVPIDLKAGIGRRLEQQREIVGPIAGHDTVGSGRLDLGDIRREVGDLLQRVHLVADDLDIGAFLREHLARGAAHGLAERIILVDQIDLLDVGARLHVVGERFHLDVGIGVPAEMPIAAFLVGEHRIDGGIVEIDDFLARIAFVVLADLIFERSGDVRAVALRDDANAGVERLLQLNQALLGIDLVVVADDFELVAEHAALGIDLFGEILKRLESRLAGARGEPGQRIDESDPNGLLRARGRTQQYRRAGQQRRLQMHGIHWTSSRFRRLRCASPSVAEA